MNCCFALFCLRHFVVEGIQVVSRFWLGTCFHFPRGNTQEWVFWFIWSVSLTYKKLSTCFPDWPPRVLAPTTNVWDSCSLCVLDRSGIVRVSVLAVLVSMSRHRILALVCISLMANDVERLFNCIFVICMSFWWGVQMFESFLISLKDFGR